MYNARLGKLMYRNYLLRLICFYFISTMTYDPQCLICQKSDTYLLGLYTKVEPIKEVHVPQSLEKAEDYSYRVDSERDWYTFLEACRVAGGNQVKSVHTGNVTRLSSDIIKQAGKNAAIEQFDQGEILNEWRAFIQEIKKTQDYSKLHQAEFHDLVRNLEQLLVYIEQNPSIARNIILAPEGADEISMELHLQKMKDLVTSLGEDGQRAIRLFNQAYSLLK